MIFVYILVGIITVSLALYFFELLGKGIIRFTQFVNWEAPDVPPTFMGFLGVIISAALALGYACVGYSICHLLGIP